MNSLRAIAIEPSASISHDDRSRSRKSCDSYNSSWKLEKIVDERGKSNYKVVTSHLPVPPSSHSSDRRRNSRKNIINAGTIGAYGVPGNKAYLNNKAPTLHAGIIRSARKTRKSSSPSLQNDHLKQIQDISDSSARSGKNDLETSLERYGEVHEHISKNLIVGNDQVLIPYTNENDLLQKSYQHGHLITNNTYLQSFHLLFSYFGTKKIPYLTVSIWSQLLSPHIELINLLSIPIKNLESNKGKLIVKDIHTDLLQRGQLFITVNLPEEYSGYMSLKYNLELVQMWENNKEMDVAFEFPHFFSNSGSDFVSPVKKQEISHEERMTSPKLLPPSLEEDREEDGENLPILESLPQEIPIRPSAYKEVIEKMQLPKLTGGIFGNFITSKNDDNIPIFHQKPTVVGPTAAPTTPAIPHPPSLTNHGRRRNNNNNNMENSHFSMLQSTFQHANPLTMDNVPDITEDLDYTEENDISRLLNILRNPENQ